MNAMSGFTKWVAFLVGIASLLISDIAGYVAPREEPGDFTLYNHGEISKYNGYKGDLALETDLSSSRYELVTFR